MQAIGKNVLITPIKQEKKKQIIITTETEKITTWRVISIGEQVVNLDVGDQIFLKMYGHEKISDNPEIYVTDSEHICAKK